MKNKKEHIVHKTYILCFLTLLCMFIPSILIQARLAESLPKVSVTIAPSASAEKVVLYAMNVIFDELSDTCKPLAQIQMRYKREKRGNILLAIDPSIIEKSLNKASAESYRIIADRKGAVQIIGADPVGVLWGVRDFVHYYARTWLDGLSQKKPHEFDFASAPRLHNRCLWTWWKGCIDPFAYIDRASEWKINTVVFWNEGVPLDAQRLTKYAHERGVKIWWGFSWGWTSSGFRDASPGLAEYLVNLYESQTRKNGIAPASLCPSEPESIPAMKAFVMDLFENQYAWLPEIDGIYFQTATEAVCECERCRNKPLGDTLMPMIMPILEEMHQRYPDLPISWGVHNYGFDIKEFEILKEVPGYVNLCWEATVTWARRKDIAEEQLTYRQPNEDYAGLYRIGSAASFDARSSTCYNYSTRQWLPRFEKIWEYLEECQPECAGNECRMFSIAYDDRSDLAFYNAWTGDWRPNPITKRLVDNLNFREFLEWSRMLVEGPPTTKGIFLCLEASFVELKMRRQPAMLAEAMWDPMNEGLLESRCQAIWKTEVGGWRESPNPFWERGGDAITVYVDDATSTQTLWIKEYSEVIPK